MSNKMSKFRILGGRPLRGKVKVAGNKNSALKLMTASLLCDDPITLLGSPRIKDVEIMGKLISNLGAEVQGLGPNTLRIDSSKISSWEINPDLARRIRASIALVAPLLWQFGKVKLPRSGGDSIGERLLDTHFTMLSQFGAKIKARTGYWFIENKNLHASEIFLEEASVTATEMALMLASRIPGKTVIEGAACEPHIVDLADFLTSAGAKIEGAGTHLIRVRGAKKLKGVRHKVRPDHIEVGTFAIASAVTGGNILIQGVIPQDLKIILAYLSHMGVEYKLLGSNKLKILPSTLIAKKKKFHTRPWPGFPTDLMSSFIVLATQTRGTVLCHDWMYEWRIFFVDNLIGMGADITIADPHRVIVNGPAKLYGDIIPSADIRAGGALVLAALAAEGESIVEHVGVIDRGHEDFEKRLTLLGAKIERIE